MKTKSLFLLPALILNLSLPQKAEAGSFTPTGSLSGARAGHSATLLRDGKVLVVGGYNGQQTDRLASCELYDPATGTWTATGALSTGRTRHAATLLPNWKVLVTGGGVSDTNSTIACELYDPFAGTWTPTGAMITARDSHTATLLLNGKVLVAGGYNRDQASDLCTAELYDPATGTWTPAGLLATARNTHTAMLLFGGMVLIAGGAIDRSYSSLSSAELFDPATGAWKATGSMISPRQYHRMALLTSGRVLVTGGDSDGNIISGAELYEPTAGTWTPTAALTNARTAHTATLLPDGKVLAASGLHDLNTGGELSSAEVYDPASGSWTPSGTLSTARDGHTATLLPNGKVLVAAGYISSTSVWLSSAELYDSALGPITVVNPTKLPNGAFQFAFTSAANGTYSALATTDLALPLVYSPYNGVLNWTVLHAVPEFSPGLYVFSDPQATNSPQRFYQVVAGQPCQGPNPCPCAYKCVSSAWTQYATCRDCP